MNFSNLTIRHSRRNCARDSSGTVVGNSSAKGIINSVAHLSRFLCGLLPLSQSIGERIHLCLRRGYDLLRQFAEAVKGFVGGFWFGHKIYGFLNTIILTVSPICSFAVQVAAIPIFSNAPISRPANAETVFTPKAFISIRTPFSGTPTCINLPASSVTSYPDTLSISAICIPYETASGFSTGLVTTTFPFGKSLVNSLNAFWVSEEISRQENSALSLSDSRRAAFASSVAVAIATEARRSFSAPRTDWAFESSRVRWVAMNCDPNTAAAIAIPHTTAIMLMFVHQSALAEISETRRSKDSTSIPWSVWALMVVTLPSLMLLSFIVYRAIDQTRASKQNTPQHKI